MEENRILPNNPKVILDNDEEFYCGIELDKEQVGIHDIQKRAKSEGFREQTDRHITVLSSKPGDRLFEKLHKATKPQKKALIKQLESLFLETDWTFIPENLYYVGRETKDEAGETQEYREAYIRTIKMPGLEEFYKKLNKVFSTRIPPRFPHITLFTRGEGPDAKYLGIPIPTCDAFKALKAMKIQGQ